ncbi:gamma-glutamyl-gamma-aminobutyrate hydrolase family protein [Thalassoroseus pseudoceratinae]|uniref:gamma-glutamyl-gamma-aminobutyrate hydrolase family protein n=1 Tax=Thalassoroseus pseudoceratinae TaxID=2713176 RepID=UPI001420595E|nr:gamma-glutamyl-gamma-aminobutyrate hydrolase family protein [Thalassoroseus pseudoceratinae]
MARKPLIGINADFRPARKDSIPLTWINSGYYDSVTAAGGLPMVIPPLASDDDLRQYLEMLDGLVITGGALDLDPIRLGLEPHPSTRPMPNRREDFDRRLCRLAVEMKIPVLAIGLGMQELNVVCGGTLYQHVTEDVPKAFHHRDTVENCLRHIIDIVPGTRVDKIYGPGEIRVNSQHHMAVDQLAHCFKVSATAGDGVIEAYESISDDWFCLGVQWHPENTTASALDMQVFENFLEACEEPEPALLQMPQRRAA